MNNKMIEKVLRHKTFVLGVALTAFLILALVVLISFLRIERPENLYVFRKNDGSQYGYVNERGEIKIPITYDDAEPFFEGYAAVKKDDKWGHINTKGKLVGDYKYNSSYTFVNGLAVVEQGSEDGIINTKGDYIVKMGEYKSVVNIGENRFFAMKSSSDYVILNEKGNEIESTKDIILAYIDGMYIGANESLSKYAYLDKNLELQGDGFVYEDISFFKDGRAVVKENGRYKLINKKFKLEKEFKEGYDLVAKTEDSIVFSETLEDGASKLRVFNYKGKEIETIDANFGYKTFNGDFVAITGSDGETEWNIYDSKGEEKSGGYENIAFVARDKVILKTEDYQYIYSLDGKEQIKVASDKFADGYRLKELTKDVYYYKNTEGKTVIIDGEEETVKDITIVSDDYDFYLNIKDNFGWYDDHEFPMSTVIVTGVVLTIIVSGVIVGRHFALEMIFDKQEAKTDEIEADLE